MTTTIVGTGHDSGVERLLESYRAIPPDARSGSPSGPPTCSAARAPTDAPGLDTSGLTAS